MMTVPAPGQDSPHVGIQPSPHTDFIITKAGAFTPAAIEKLVAALEAANQSARVNSELADKWQKECGQLGAALEAATRERDRRRADMEALHGENQGWKSRAEAAERALEAARDALREIAGLKYSHNAWDIARSALDASASTENTP